MSRVCYFTGKKTVAGRSISRRGKAKYLGGVGRRVTGVTKRKFKPNIQKVRAIVDRNRPVFLRIQGIGHAVYRDEETGRRLEKDAIAIRAEVVKGRNGLEFRSNVL